MRTLLNARIIYNRFEVGCITALLIAISLRGAIGVSGTFVALMHATAMLLLYVMLRAALSYISETVARLFFAVSAILLIVEGLIQFLTGLHINWFVISLLLEDNSARNIGISPTAWAGITLLAVFVLLALRIKINKSQDSAVSLTFVATGCFTAVIAGQAIYTAAYFSGSAQIMQARRNLPFFSVPHPYLMRKAISTFIHLNEDNLFSEAQIKRLDTQENLLLDEPLLKAVNKPNILFIITDSLRSSELKKYPELTPTMNAAAKRGHLSLNQYSTSNCTHFSFYSMFTGRIATTFGQARQNAVARGLIPQLIAAGYEVSTAESIALEWYDIDKTIFPTAVKRWTPPDEIEDTGTRDNAAVQRTIAQLSSWRNSETPRTHITYLEGSHFPYSQSIIDATDTIQARYHATIRQFDQRLANIFEAMEQQGIADNTLIIVTSDHGEELLSEGRMGHSSTLNDLQTVVPLLVIGGNANTVNIRSHTDIRPFILNQIAPDTHPFTLSPVTYLANCDYDFPKDFQVITNDGKYNFDYNNGYLTPIDGKENQSLKAAQLLMQTIQSGGFPVQP